MSLLKQSHQTLPGRFLWRSGLMNIALSLRERLRDADARQEIRTDFLATAQQIRLLAPPKTIQPNGKQAFVVSSLHLMSAKKLDVLWAIVLQSEGYNVIGVEGVLRYADWTRRYFDLVEVSTLINLHQWSAHVPEVQPTDFMLHFLNTQTITIPALLDTRFEGVAIGRIALGKVLANYRFRNFDINEPTTRRDLYDAMALSQRFTLGAQALLQEYKPAVIVSTEKGLSPIAELYEVAMNYDVPFIQYTKAQTSNDFILRRYRLELRYEHPFSLIPETWQSVQKMPWGNRYEEELMEDFTKSYAEGAWFNRKFLLKGKQIKEQNEVSKQLGLDPTKKTAVVFSHVLWDATFFYGRNLFDDYETWLFETVRAAVKNPRVNWVIKLHPDLVWKLNQAGYTGPLRDSAVIEHAIGSEIPEHITIVKPDTDISTYSFFSITDYCLTVRGTIGIEMACYRVPVITAGSGRYSALGFTTDPKTKQEYLNILAHIEEHPPMTDYQLELARRFAYALFKLRPWSLRTFDVSSGDRAKVQSPTNPQVSINVNSYDTLIAAPDIQNLKDWLRSQEADHMKHLHTT